MELILKDTWREVGNTPLIQVTPRIYAKLETVNPTGSIKDRPISFIIKDAIDNDLITNSTTLVEATSGNTGISLSAIGTSLGLPVKIIMPKNMSIERRQMMESFGADIIYVDDGDFEGAIEFRNQMCQSDQNCWSPMQFENLLNVKCHKSGIGAEIIADIERMGASWSAFISGAGTGGTVMGVREAIIEKGWSTHVCLVRPLEENGLHGIQGIGDGNDFLANPDLMDVIKEVKTADAIQRAKKFSRTHGILVGISAGANICAAEDYIKTFNPTGIVVTILCDRGERYLSVFNKQKQQHCTF